MDTSGQEPITRSEGITPSERFLSQLCENSFLSMWSYPGIFRDQGNARTGEGKEVCDLLVIFENHIIIFSDKNCEFPRSGDTAQDWSRWYRRAVRDSAKQIYGAERWIKKFPNRLFMDSKCKTPLPIHLPLPNEAIFHRIVVARAASQRCSEELGGSGSLMIIPHIIGDQHHTSSANEFTPFAIGQVDESRGYVHVLDETALIVTLSTLDTVTDFINYLSRKESFISSGKLGSATGEDDLIAWYLRNVNEKQEHDFVIPVDIDSVSVGEGCWQDFTTSETRKRQVAANRVSYSWDALIETFSHHILARTSYYNSHAEIAEQERMLRFLAREPRTRRRYLATLLLEFIGKVPQTHRATRTVLPWKEGDPYYVFMVLPHPQEIEIDEYRTARRAFLQAYCENIKLKYPQAKDIIGIATESGRGEIGSEDLIYFDARDWTSEDQLRAETNRQVLIENGALGKFSFFRSQVKEYPSATDVPFALHLGSSMKGYQRNTPCPCGNGKKFKKCCGSAS